MLLVERPAQAARTQNPTPIHFSYVLLSNVVVYVSNCGGKQGATEQKLEGGLGGEALNPNLEWLGWLGRTTLTTWPRPFLK